jgi:hypothetical protein
MVFGRKKLAEQQAALALQKQQLEDLARQKEQQEHIQGWKELQMKEQLQNQKEEIRLKELQWENELQDLQMKENQQREREQQAREFRENEEKEKRGREQRRLERLKLTSPEALRRVRDLIRTRHQLDMFIWSLRGVRGPDRPLVTEKMEKADAVLMEIYAMVETWEENERIWTAEEWKLAQKIKERILADGKKWWGSNYLWNEA